MECGATEDQFAVMFSYSRCFKKFFAGSQVIDDSPITLYILLCVVINSLKVLGIPYIKDSNQTGIFICFIQNPRSGDWNRLNSQITEDPNLFAKKWGPTDPRD